MIIPIEAALNSSTGFVGELSKTVGLAAELTATSVLDPTRFIKLPFAEHVILPDFPELVIEGKVGGE